MAIVIQPDFSLCRVPLPHYRNQAAAVLKLFDQRIGNLLNRSIEKYHIKRPLPRETIGEWTFDDDRIVVFQFDQRSRCKIRKVAIAFKRDHKRADP